MLHAKQRKALAAATLTRLNLIDLDVGELKQDFC